MSGICDTCQRNQVCRRPMDGMDSCRLYMRGTFQYYEEINLQEIVDEQARKLQRRVDEATLDKAADTLAKFGYVKADGKNRWFELFGTPERAARTLRNIPCGYEPCVDCPIYEPCCGKFSEEHYNPLLEWLKGDAK